MNPSLSSDNIYKEPSLSHGIGHEANNTDTRRRTFLKITEGNMILDEGKLEYM